MSSVKCTPDCTERTECKTVGVVGHFQCGVCPEHHQPRHHCGCIVFTPVAASFTEKPGEPE